MIVRWKKGAIPENGFGVVSWCFDGDTVRLRGMPGAEVVRLWGMDAPERGQRGSRLAGAALWEMVGRRRVQVVPVCRDRYGRLVARLVTMGGEDVGKAMVFAGWARWYKFYAPAALDYARAERAARKAGRGVWGMPGATFAPWSWRAKYSRHGAPRR